MSGSTYLAVGAPGESDCLGRPNGLPSFPGRPLGLPSFPEGGDGKGSAALTGLPPSSARVSQAFERIELLGFLADELRRTSTETRAARAIHRVDTAAADTPSGGSVMVDPASDGGATVDPAGDGGAKAVLPMRLIVTVLAGALAGHAASAEVTRAARLVKDQLVAARKSAAAVAVASANGRLAAPSSALERVPHPILYAICDFLEEEDVVGGLLHTNRRLRKVVCAPHSDALAHLRVTARPRAGMCLLAPGMWSRLRTLRITRHSLGSIGTPDDWWSARLARVGTRLRALHLLEAGFRILNGSVVGRLHVSVPPLVWPTLEELALASDCSGSGRPWEEGAAADASVQAAMAAAVRLNGTTVDGGKTYGAVSPPPTHLPALRRLALQIDTVRAAAFLSAAVATSRVLHTLVLNGRWSCLHADLLVVIAPQLETLSITTTEERRVEVPPLPRVRALRVDAWNIVLAAAEYPALVSLAVDKNALICAAAHDVDAGGKGGWRIPTHHDDDARGKGGWRTPQLRTLTSTMHLEALPALLAAAPGLETLNVSTTNGHVVFDVLASVFAHCVRHPLLKRIGVFGSSNGRRVAHNPRIGHEEALSALSAVLRLPRLEHLDCGSKYPLHNVDWSSASPRLRTLTWFGPQDSRPAALPSWVQWRRAGCLPAGAALPGHWCPFPLES